MVIKRMPVANIQRAKYNPRKALKPGDPAYDRLKKAVDKFGLVEPLIWNERSGNLVGGHQRLSILEERGDAVVEVSVVNLSEQEEKALNVALNRHTGEWDFASLADILQELDAGDLDMDVTGFSADDLERLMTYTAPPTDGDDDVAIPTLPANPTTRLGDVWKLDPHRLLCGDARDVAQLRRLIAGEVHLVFTSPPYASQRDYDPSTGFRPIPPDDYVEWYRSIAENVRAVLAPDGSYFLNIKPSADGTDTELYVFDLVIAHVRQWGFHFATEFCWERNGVPKHVKQRFKNQFEPIYQFSLGRWKMRPDAVRHFSPNVPTAGGPGTGATTWSGVQGGKGATSVSGSFGAAKKRRHGTKLLMSDVQGVSAAPGEYIGPGLAYPGNRLPPMAASHEALGHSAAFPVGLPAFFIQAFSDSRDAVLDPFAGSGSTIIAAERHDRIGYAIEISPAYCDVIVERWEQFTGKKADRA